MTALDCDGVEFFVLDRQVDAFIDFVAATFIVRIDRLACPLVNQLLAKPIAGLFVDLPEGDSLAR
jgi:hypothetical protein